MDQFWKLREVSPLEYSTTLQQQLYGLRVRVAGPFEFIARLSQILQIIPLWIPEASRTEDVIYEVSCLPSVRDRYEIRRNGQLLRASASRTAIPFIEQAINADLLENLRGYYLVHAGVVAFGGTGVIFAAAGGSGKTTLVAGCVAGGASYLSDEVAVIDPRTRSVLPFAKSMYVREGARDTLASVFPSLAEESDFVQPNGERVWYLPPRGEWLPITPAKVSVIVLPTHRPGEPTKLARVPRSTALQTLLQQSFNLDRHRGRHLGPLIALIESVACFRLTYQHWQEGVVAVGNEIRG